MEIEFFSYHTRTARDHAQEGPGEGLLSTNSPKGGDGGVATGLAVERRGCVAEHGLLQWYPLGRAGVDRVGRRHPRCVRVRPRVVVLLSLDLRRVVRDANGGRGRLGGHSRRRRSVRGSGTLGNTLDFGEGKTVCQPCVLRSLINTFFLD
jgi:hypothetical protein